MKLRAAAIALLAGAALVLSGCGLVTPVATQFPYAPSDGVQGKVGEVTLLNVFAVTELGSDSANLVFVARNMGEATTLNVQVETAGGRTDIAIPLAANASTNVGFGDAGALEVTGLDIIPGDLLNVYFQYGTEEGVQLPVPILDGTLPYYSDLVPAGAPEPAPAPTETPAEEPETDDEH